MRTSVNIHEKLLVDEILGHMFETLKEALRTLFYQSSSRIFRPSAFTVNGNLGSGLTWRRSPE